MIYFFSLKDKYLSPAGPESQETKTVISVRVGNKFKKIEYSNKGKAPHSLDSLVSQVEKITKIDQFVQSRWNKKGYDDGLFFIDRQK